MIVASLILRAYLAIKLEICDMEAYQAAFSKHLAWYYLEGPSLTAWLTFLTSWLPLPSAMALRIPSLLLFSCLLFVTYDTGKRLFGSRSVVISLLLLHTSPFFFLNGFLATSTSLMLCATMLLWNLHLRLIEQPSRGRAAGVGFALALGWMSDTSMIFLLIPLILHHLLYRSRNLTWSEVLAMLAAIGVTILPLLTWSIGHENIALRYYFDHLIHGSSDLPLLSNLKAHLKTQISMLGAWLFCLSMSVCALHLWHKSPVFSEWERRSIGITLIWAVPITLCFAGLGCFNDTFHPVSMLGYLGLLLLTGFCLKGYLGGLSASARLFTAATLLGLGLLATGWLSSQITTNFRMPSQGIMSLRLGPLMYRKNSESLARSVPWGWRKLAETWKDELPIDAQFIFSDHWSSCAQLEHHFEMTTVCFSKDDARQYGIWDDFETLLGKTGYFFTTRQNDEIILLLAGYFKKVRHYKIYAISGHSEQNHLFTVYRCEGLLRPFPHRERAMMGLL